MPLSTSWGRRSVVAAVGLLVAGTLAGCGTGDGAQTNAIYDPAAGVNARGGGVDVLNLLVVANPDGSGTVSTALLNQADGTDQLTAITATNEGQELTVDAAGLPLDIEPHPQDLLNLEDEAAVYVPDVQPGYFLTLALTFTNAEPVTIDVPVVGRTQPSDMYSSVPSRSGPTEPTESAPTTEPTQSAPTTEPTTEPRRRQRDPGSGQKPGG